MIRNYFKIAWRNLRKNSFYSGINILGLFAGLAFTLLIGAYIWVELEVNSQLKNSDRQVILLSDWKEVNMGIEFTALGPLAKRLCQCNSYTFSSFCICYSGSIVDHHVDNRIIDMESGNRKSN